MAESNLIFIVRTKPHRERSMEKEKLEALIKYSSFPLRKLNASNIPIGVASAGIIKYKGKIFLLSVQHAFKDGRWAVEERYEPGNGTKLRFVGNVNFLKRADLSRPNQDFKDIDFVYKIIDGTYKSHFQEINQHGEIISEVEREPITTNLNSAPDSLHLYGFSGNTEVQLKNGVLTGIYRTYLDLKYVGDNGDFHMFELPFAFPGNEYFKGCSGAPIVDNDGNLVSLVCGSPSGSNNIYGISLSKFKIALDIEAGAL